MSDFFQSYNTLSIDRAFGKFRLELVLELKPAYSVVSSHEGFILKLKALFKVKPPEGSPPPELERVAGRLYERFVHHYWDLVSKKRGGEREIIVLSYKENLDGEAVGYQCPYEEGVTGEVTNSCIFWNLLKHIDTKTLRGFLTSISSGLTDKALSSILGVGGYHKSYGRNLSTSITEGANIFLYRDAFGMKALYEFRTNSILDDDYSLLSEIVDRGDGEGINVEKVISYRGSFDGLSYYYSLFLLFDVYEGIKKALSKNGGFEIEESLIYRGDTRKEEKVPVSASSQEPELDMPLSKVRALVRARLPISIEPKVAFFGYSRKLNSIYFDESVLSGGKESENGDILRVLYPKPIDGIRSISLDTYEQDFFMVPGDTKAEFGDVPGVEEDVLGPRLEEGGIEDVLKAMSRIERMERNLQTASCLMGRAVSLLFPDMSPEDISQKMRKTRTEAMLRVIRDYEVDLKSSKLRPFEGAAKVLEYLVRQIKGYNLLARTNVMEDETYKRRNISLEAVIYPDVSFGYIENTALRVGGSMFDLVMIGNLTKKYLNRPATPLARSFSIKYSSSLQM